MSKIIFVEVMLKMANSHVEEFVVDYCFSSVSQNYAVMLNGPWGVGKTWFVDKLIRRIKEKSGSALYVSLYGLSSFSAIEYEFYRKLHPILSSKGMEIAGKIFKGALKTTLKVDLNNDGRSDGTINVSVPDINLPEYLKNTSGLVLIFDDVERCSIEISDLLGYINHFVEHQDYKVILVANEVELEKGGKYQIIKEKLVGKTFEIMPELDEALEKFIGDTGRPDFYEVHRNVVKDVYVQSEYRNLRHLRQSLLDFTHLMMRLPEDVTDSQELMSHLLQVFLMFVFEIRHGKFAVDNIRNLRAEWIARAVASGSKRQGEEKSESSVEMLVRKYQFFRVDELLLEANVWVDVVGRSIVNQDLVTSQLRNTKYLLSATSPDWIRLWHFRSHTDSEFASLVKAVWERFERNCFSELHEIKHICGMMMFFSSKGLFHKSIDDVLNVARSCIDSLGESGVFNKKPILGFRENESALGLVYLSCESEKFKGFCRDVFAQQEVWYMSTFASLGAELMKLLPDNPELFSNKLCCTDFASGDTYYDVPILSDISPREFVDALLKVKPDELYLVCRFFVERYKGDGFSGGLASEREWVKTVVELVGGEVVDRAGSLSGYCLSEVLERFIKVPIGSGGNEYN